jgi:hypothetical protein
MDNNRWFLLILVELLTITQWIKVRGCACWYRGNCWPSLNELRWEVIFVDIGGMLTITQWAKMRGDIYWYWWNCWPSLNELRWEVIFAHKLIEWWSTIPSISTKITSHLNSLSDGQQFHQYQQKSPLTSTHWLMVNNSTLMELLTITQWV